MASARSSRMSFLGNACGRALRTGAGLFLLLSIASCHRVPADSQSDAPLPTSDELRDQIDGALRFTFHDRRLSVQQNAAWQILHGVVAFRDQLNIWDGQRQVNALDYLLGGGTVEGWKFEPGRIDPATGRRGLRSIVDQGSKTGQGHPDQWLGYMARCGLPLDRRIRIGGADYTLSDYLSQAEWDAPRNFEREFSWTLMIQANYRTPDYQWTASDGKLWSVEKLIGIEAEHDLNESACGGTHRLTGMAMALAAHRAAGGKLEGGWAAAQEKIDGAVQTVREFQNPDGTFSTSYFVRPAADVDLKEQLGTTGHTLEFLMWALDDEAIREEWIARAAVQLCDLFQRTQKVDLECGALYHAASALVLYRERIYGAGPPLDVPSAAATEAVSSRR